MMADMATHPGRQSWRRDAAGEVDPPLRRLADVDQRYRDSDDPGALLAARMQEIIRSYATELGLCAECLAKFPDPIG